MNLRNQRIDFIVAVLSAALWGCLGFSRDGFCFELPSYEIKATVDAARKNITAQENVTFINNSNKSLRELFFHIYPNRLYTKEEKSFMMRYAGYFKVNPFPEGFQSGTLDIQAVSANGQRLRFDIEGEDKTLLKVILNEELKPGEGTRLTIDFNAVIPHAYGRFGWHKNIMALSRWYPIVSVLDENGWHNNPFYPYHRPFFSDAAQYTAEITVPADSVVIHSGELKKEVTQGATKTLFIQTKLPIREFTFSLSPDYKVIEGLAGDVNVKSFYLAGDEFYAKEALQDALDVMRYYTGRFGAYPHQTFSIAPVYLGYGGEQMSNMILIDTRAYRLPKILKRYFDFLVSHETGHQWFYNMVGSDEFTQMWLEEGVNSYFNLEYLESKYGPEAAVVKLPKAVDWLLPDFSFRRGRDYRYKLIARTQLDRPVTGKLSGFTEPAAIFSITYGKGSAIVAMLRDLIGEDAFQKIFARIFKEYRFKNFTIENLISLCREETGQDLTWFFNEWLDTSEKYDVSVEGVKGNTVRLKNRGKIVMPTPVEVGFSDGRKQELIWDGRKETIDVAGGASPIRYVRLDPQERLLDIDRTNNAYPKVFHFKPVWLYHGLYDIPLFLPDNGYNLVFGPELANSGVGIKASVQKPYDWDLYAASDYDVNDSLQKSRLGYQLNNIFNSMRTVGFELFNISDYDNGEEDLAGAKAYVRQELWPASYGLTGINDHITFYLLRNRNLNQGSFSVGGREDTRNVSYLKKDEAIIGSIFHLGRAGTFPDPSEGYQADIILENSNHMLGATQYFYRGSLDWAGYYPLTPKTKVALRLKYGWGYPLDKNLYELGGMDGLRGYDRKTLRGARMALGSFEYRFPIKENLGIHFFDNVLNIESLHGVVFFDGGRSWFNDFSDSEFKKDAGLGLRATVNIASFLEKILVRFDAAQAIHEPKEKAHFWFGVGHAF